MSHRSIEKEEFYDSEEDDDNVFGGFVCIESFCTLCQGAFLFKSLLHKHLKTCKIPDLTCLALLAFAQLPIPVMESNALVKYRDSDSEAGVIPQSQSALRGELPRAMSAPTQMAVQIWVLSPADRSRLVVTPPF